MSIEKLCDIKMSHVGYTVNIKNLRKSHVGHFYVLKSSYKNFGISLGYTKDIDISALKDITLVFYKYPQNIQGHKRDTPRNPIAMGQIKTMSNSKYSNKNLKEYYIF